MTFRAPSFLAIIFFRAVAAFAGVAPVDVVFHSIVADRILVLTQTPGCFALARYVFAPAGTSRIYVALRFFSCSPHLHAYCGRRAFNLYVIHF